LKVTGTYPLAGSSNYLSDTTFVRVTGNSFSQYVFYSVNEGGIQWLNNEICWGRYHTQDNLYVNGNPDFKGKVTTKKGLSLMSGTPQFEQGITKADISIPAHLDQLTNYGSTLAGGAYYQGVDTYVQFMDDGHVVVRAASVGTSPATVWGYTSATAGSVSDGAGGPSVPKYQVFNSAAALASSGVLLVQDAALHVKGELNGKITLGCIDSQTGGTKSQVWIDSSIAYASAVGVPSPPPSYQYPGNVSNSMLGIVATNTVTVSQNINHDNTKAQLNNLTLNASIFSQTSGFCAENAGTRTPGLLHLVGGLQQLTRGLVTQNGKGFTKDYDWDKNLAAGSPKGYPSTPFVVQNWIDLTTIPPDFWDN